MKRKQFGITDEQGNTIQTGYEYDYAGYIGKVSKINAKSWMLEIKDYYNNYSSLRDAKKAFSRWVDNQLRAKYGMPQLPIL